MDELRSQAIAKARAVRGNAARLILSESVQVNGGWVGR
jgi:hypothetical protein